MTKKDRTVIGLIVLALALLMTVIVKNGGNQLPMPQKPGNLSGPLSADEISAQPSNNNGQEQPVAAPRVAAKPESTTNNAIPRERLEPVEPPNRNSANAETASKTPPLTALELALRFQAAMNNGTTDSDTRSSEDSAMALLSLFAELPDDPGAEAELAQELATAYVQSSNAEEKAALTDLLLIIPSEAAMQLGQTLSRSSDPGEREIGLRLMANGGPADRDGQ